MVKLMKDHRGVFEIKTGSVESSGDDDENIRT